MTSYLTLFLLFLNIHMIKANETIPQRTKAQNVLTQANLFKRISKNKTLHFAHSFGVNESLPNSNRFTLSYRHKLSPHLSVGVISMLASGSRHNADWEKFGPTWSWRQTRDRYEFNYGAFMQYKSLLNKKGNLLFKARLHYQINNFNNQQDIIIRSGILSLLSPKVSWLNQVDFHIPTNYQRNFFREYWFYSGLGRQVTKNLFLALQLSFGVEIWNESKSFFDRTAQRFKNTNKALRAGPLINFYY